MDTRLKALFFVLMSSALIFGFLHLFVPPGTAYNFNRLHIFLFNLCSGGTILIYFSEGRERMTVTSWSFLLLALAFAICAFAEWYGPAILLALVLSLLVDSVRIRKFSLFPWDFFRPGVDASVKFHQASLLCLSIGLGISGLVVLNNTYLKWISNPKLGLDVFFLGFSFPISLITMSVMFSFMKKDVSRRVRVLKDVAFWSVNLGVITFFGFILFELHVLELLIASTLFMTVIMIYCLYLVLGVPAQQKTFLTSGMTFLVLTAVTGIGYILMKFYPSPSAYEISGKLLLRMHAFVSLYGWNLSGLVVICRFSSFPIRLNSRAFVAVHWLTVLILAPLGKYYQVFAVPAVMIYMSLLFVVFFATRKPERLPSPMGQSLH